MLIHTIFDLVAWVAAALFARWIARSHLLDAYATKRSLTDDPGYFLCLAVGALAGAWVSGSLNLTLAHIWTLGHSIAGAIAGGIVGVELYKFARGIRGSTGLVFVGPLALGIAIGRLGCFFAGLPDYTYGVPTSLPWGVDFGDGIHRHPVQLYESGAMWAFLAVYVAALRTARAARKSIPVIPGECERESACTREGDPGVGEVHILPERIRTAHSPLSKRHLLVPLPLALLAQRSAGDDSKWPTYFLANSFYLFVGWYALQRFLWEFLKPYPPVIGPFNLFHLICAALFGYSLFMLRGRHDIRPAV